MTNSAYQWLENYNEDQCIVILGESGSGKTETSRMCVHFLTQISDIRKELKLTQSKCSNLLNCSKGGSLPNSKVTTPKHDPITISSSNVNSNNERIGCLVVKNHNTNNSNIRKSSHEKSVDFDFSNNSNESLTKCSKHSSQLINSCSKHNKCDSLTQRQLHINSSTSSKCNSCHHYHHNHIQENSNSNTLPYIKSSLGHKKNNSINSKFTTSSHDCICDHSSNLVNITSSISLTSLTKKNTNLKRTPIFNKKLNSTPSSKLTVSTSSLQSTSIKLEKEQSNLEQHKIRERIAQADILLEALGNATTIKNSNSSRYGKFFDIEFDFKGEPISAQVTHCKYILFSFYWVIFYQIWPLLILP